MHEIAQEACTLFKLLFLAGVLSAFSLYADTTTLTPSKDNTLYESSDGSLSNGAGFYLFVGATAGNSVRRVLLRFYLSSIEAGATIDSARLVLQMDRSNAGATTIFCHRLLADLGEANSVGTRGEGAGASAESGDATWLHGFFPSTSWSNVGGDFLATASASQSVDGTGSYTWTSQQLKADVQTWVDSATVNFGWILIGDESTTTTSKRFLSRDSNDSSLRPQLIVDYTPSAANNTPLVGDFNGDDLVDFSDFFAFADRFGLTTADANWDAQYDIDADNDVDFDDFFVFADNFGKRRN